MRHANVHVFIHYVWATWDRLPLITPDIREEVYRLILAKCTESNVAALALGGVEDHIHLLVRLPATVTIAKAIADIKGFSAHAIAHKYKEERLFSGRAAMARSASATMMSQPSKTASATRRRITPSAPAQNIAQAKTRRNKPTAQCPAQAGLVIAAQRVQPPGKPYRRTATPNHHQ